MARVIVLVIMTLLLISGCSVPNQLCIEAHNLSYDGNHANGMIKVTNCSVSNSEMNIVEEYVNVSRVMMINGEVACE